MTTPPTARTGARRLVVVLTCLSVLAVFANPAAADPAPSSTDAAGTIREAAVDAPEITARGGTSGLGGPGTVWTPAAEPTTAPRGSAQASASGATTDSARATPPNDDFDITYGATVTAAERQAFEAAAGIWSAVLQVDVPIDVTIGKEFLDPGVLGGAAPSDFYRFGESLVYFAAAEANQLADRDINGGDPEIDVVFTSRPGITFYTGTDDAVPPGQYSLMTLALHELGHGLGHTTWAFCPNGTGTGCSVRDPDGTYFVYDLFVTRSDETSIIDLTGAALHSALHSDALWWNGDGGTAENGDARIRLYAPTSFEQGSSISHVDRDNQVMSPGIPDGTAYLTVPAYTGGMLRDIGWLLESHTPDEAFVRAVVRDFLGRDATYDEIVFFTDELRAGAGRGDVVREFAFSDEWVGAIVEGYYQSTLGRPSDAGGKAYWTSVIQGGETPANVAAYFYASDEYFQRSGNTNRAWVRSLYRELLGREGDTNGVNYWSGLADSGTPRQTIALDFYQSIESRRFRVRALYRTLLGRDPDSNGWSYWADILSNGRDVDLAIFLASSAEYYSRAGRRFG